VFEVSIVAFVAALLAAQEISGFAPEFSFGIAGVSVLGILALLIKLQRSVIGPLSRRADDLEAALRRERLERRVSDWRINQIAKIVNRSGGTISIPDEVMYGRPEWAIREAEEMAS